MQVDVGLNGQQLENLKKWMKSKSIQLELNTNEKKQIDEEVGAGNPLVIGSKDIFMNEMDPQVCPFWNQDLCKEVATEIDLFLRGKVCVDEQLLEMPALDYCAPGVQQGLQILFGGDMGDHVFRIHQAPLDFTKGEKGGW